MKKILSTWMTASFFAFAFASTSFAESMPVLDGNLDYTFTKVKHKADDIAEVQIKLAGFGLQTVFDSSTEPALEKNSGELDGIYSTADLTKAAFLIVGAKPNSDEFYQTILIDQNGYLVHAHAKDGTPYALYLRDFTLDETKSLMAKLEVSAHPAKLFLKVAFIAKAFGDVVARDANATDNNGSCATCGITDKKTDAASASGIMKDLSSNTFMKTAYGCVIGAGKGLWDGTGGAIVGTVVGTAKLAWNLTFHTKDTAKVIWGDVNHVWDFTKTLVTDFDRTAAGLYKNFADLDPKIRGEMICDTISSLGSAALLTYLTVGGGSEAFLKKLADVLAKFEKTEKYAAALKATAEIKAVNKAEAVAKAAGKVSSGIEDQNLAKQAAKDGYKFVKKDVQPHIPDTNQLKEDLVGKKVIATYSESSGPNAGKLTKVKGIVLEQHSMGYQVLADDGKIHDVSFGKGVVSHDVFAKPGVTLNDITKTGSKLSHTEYRDIEVTQAIEKSTRAVGGKEIGPRVIAELPDGKGGLNRFTGEIKVVKKTGMPDIYELTDDNGAAHRMNPKILDSDYGKGGWKLTKIDGDPKLAAQIKIVPDKPISVNYEKTLAEQNQVAGKTMDADRYGGQGIAINRGEGKLKGIGATQFEGTKQIAHTDGLENLHDVLKNPTLLPGYGLNDEDRVAAAEKGLQEAGLLKGELSPEAREALRNHLNNPGVKEPAYFEHSSAELKAKMKNARTAGLDSKQADFLIRKGYAGSAEGSAADAVSSPPLTMAELKTKLAGAKKYQDASPTEVIGDLLQKNTSHLNNAEFTELALDIVNNRVELGGMSYNGRAAAAEKLFKTIEETSQRIDLSKSQAEEIRSAMLKLSEKYKRKDLVDAASEAVFGKSGHAQELPPLTMPELKAKLAGAKKYQDVYPSEVIEDLLRKNTSHLNNDQFTELSLDIIRNHVELGGSSYNANAAAASKLFKTIEETSQSFDLSKSQSEEIRSAMLKLSEKFKRKDLEDTASAAVFGKSGHAQNLSPLTMPELKAKLARAKKYQDAYPTEVVEDLLRKNTSHLNNDQFTELSLDIIRNHGELRGSLYGTNAEEATKLFKTIEETSQRIDLTKTQAEEIRNAMIKANRLGFKTKSKDMEDLVANLSLGKDEHLTPKASVPQSLSEIKKRLDGGEKYVEPNAKIAVIKEVLSQGARHLNGTEFTDLALDLIKKRVGRLHASWLGSYPNHKEMETIFSEIGQASQDISLTPDQVTQIKNAMSDANSLSFGERSDSVNKVISNISLGKSVHDVPATRIPAVSN